MVSLIIGFTEDTVIDHINIWKYQHHMLTVNDEFQCHSLHLAILAFRALIVIQRINHEQFSLNILYETCGL